jgi:hypothetical protein
VVQDTAKDNKNRYKTYHWAKEINIVPLKAKKLTKMTRDTSMLYRTQTTGFLCMVPPPAAVGEG